jgi:hypothetical protein
MASLYADLLQFEESCERRSPIQQQQIPPSQKANAAVTVMAHFVRARLALPNRRIAISLRR